MAVIDVDALSIEEVQATDDEVYAHLDELCLSLVGMTADEFVSAVREGRRVDHPAAARLEILARLYI